MTDESTTTDAPSKRPSKAAEEKAALRAQLATVVNKVPDRVNAGSVQTTRQWVAENKKAAKDVTRTRISRRALRESLERMQEWREEAQSTASA